MEKAEYKTIYSDNGNTLKTCRKAQVCWHIAETPASRKLRQEDLSKILSPKTRNSC